MAMTIPAIQETLRDEDLVPHAQAGDEAAFTELVHRHESRVYTLALNMLRNPGDAEDVLQETFISALHGLKGFRGDSSFSTWLYRIAYNATLMKLRKPATAVSLDVALEGPASLCLCPAIRWSGRRWWRWVGSAGLSAHL